MSHPQFGNGGRVGGLVPARAYTEQTPTPKVQHITTLRAEAKRLSERLAQVNRELAALGVYDG